MFNVLLTDVDIKNLLAIINNTQIKGDTAEVIVGLKQKLSAQLPKEPQKPEDPKA